MGNVKVSVPRDCPFPTRQQQLTTTALNVTYKQTYCLDVSPDCNGPIEIDLASQTPNPDSNYVIPGIGETYQFNGEVDLDVFVSNIGPLKKGKSLCRYTRDVTWSTLTGGIGGPIDPPEGLFPEVDIEFQEFEKPGENFQFLGFCDAAGVQYGQWFGDTAPPVPDNGPLKNLVITPGDIGPIRNSAGCERLRNVLCYRHIVRARVYAQRYDCELAQLGGVCNSEPVLLLEFDESNITFDCVYPAQTLTILNVNKEVVDFFGTNIVCLEFVMQYDPSGPVFKELDSGTQAAFVPGAIDPSLFEQYGNNATIHADDDRLKENKTGKRDLDTRGPVLLNGEGVEACLPNEQDSTGFIDPIYLAYIDLDKQAIDFTTLPVSIFVTPP